MANVDGIGRFCVYDAPMALNSDLARTNGLDPRVAEARNKRHIYGLRRCMLGPMPVEKFVQNAVGYPLDSDRSAFLSAKNAFRSVPPTADTPEQIFEPLLAALNKQTKHKSRCPGFIFENTARRSLHPNHLGYAKPHISCFSKRNLKTVRSLSRRSRSELGYAEMFIQVTADVTQDYFTDPPPDLDAELRASFDILSSTRQRDRDMREELEDALGLHIAFVTEVFARQHRNAYHSISMAGSRARLYRWDRAGCIVSEAFDIREHPEHLCEFLWRFSRTSDSSRGHDRTVTPATMEQELQFKTIVKEYVRSQLEVDGEALEKALSQHYAPGHAAIVKVYPHRAPLSHSNVLQFIISRPVVSPLSLIGRGTRGYWAVETTTLRVVFLKDTWHIGQDGGVEGDLLNHLNQIGVRNVPSLVVHGDVPDWIPNEKNNVLVWQTTVTARVANAPWVCCVAGQPVSTTDVRRYRLVMGTVGYGLSTMKGTEELLHATYDVFTAMRDALSKDSRIHRDISVGNIILVKVPGQAIRQGYLIDWEASDRVDDSGQSLHPGRAGTWHFMSWRMLHYQQAQSKQTFLDDMESLIHVVTYCALLYLPHKLSRQDLIAAIEDYFEKKHETADGDLHGGDWKATYAVTRGHIEEAGFGSEALAEWLTTMLEYQCPGRTLNYKYGELWTPEHVDAFWSNFLNTHTLERDNRVVHDTTRTQYYGVAKLSTTPPSAPPTPIRKRSAERDSSGEVPATKRRRSLRLQGPGALASSPAPVSRGVVDGPRRSQRIKATQSGAQAPAASARAPRTGPTPARRGARGRGRGRSRR